MNKEAAETFWQDRVESRISFRETLNMLNRLMTVGVARSTLELGKATFLSSVSYDNAAGNICSFTLGISSPRAVVKPILQWYVWSWQMGVWTCLCSWLLSKAHWGQYIILIVLLLWHSCTALRSLVLVHSLKQSKELNFFHKMSMLSIRWIEDSKHWHSSLDFSLIVKSLTLLQQRKLSVPWINWLLSCTSGLSSSWSHYPSLFCSSTSTNLENMTFFFKIPQWFPSTMLLCQWGVVPISCLTVMNIGYCTYMFPYYLPF